jgi:AcrR family transcriptional regulator
MTDPADSTDEPRYIPRSGAMFSRASLAKADLATNLAIPIVAEGGWPALTLRNVAHAANVTPQAIAAWFPSVAVMRAAVASRYGDRWIRERGYLARTRTRTLSARSGVEAPTLSALAVALLPQSWLEAVYDGIWITIVEAGRWDDAVGSVVAAVQERERDLVRELLERSEPHAPEDLEPRVELALALVRGLRAGQVPPREGLAADVAGVLAALGAAG